MPTIRLDVDEIIRRYDTGKTNLFLSEPFAAQAPRIVVPERGARSPVTKGAACPSFPYK